MLQVPLDIDKSVEMNSIHSTTVSQLFKNIDSLTSNTELFSPFYVS